MRIGFFSDSYFPEIDGVTYTVQSWKERLEERGHEVYIIYPESDDYEPGEREIPVRSVPNPFYSGYNIPIPISTDLPDLDVVHCHSPAPVGWLGKFYSNRKDVPAVYTHHTPIEEYFDQAVPDRIAGVLGKLYVPMEEIFLSSFDKVITNTEEGRRDIKTVKLDAGVDMRFFQSRETEEEERVIGYSGRVSSEKNLDKVVEMSKEINAKLIIVGEGPAREKVEADAPENVEFRDFMDRENLPEHYSTLDVFVTASTGDTLGLSPLEANACGTPVVAPDIHPFDKTVGDGNGYTYRLDDMQDFRKQVRKALDTEWDTRKAVEKYSLETSIDRIEEIYADLEVD